MNCNLLRFALVALSLLLIPAFAKAQVNGPGPSDPALFDTVINLPPDPNIGNHRSIGGVTGQTNQLNVMNGGSVGHSFTAFSGSEVNISGGTVGDDFDARAGSEVNISGGTVGNDFDANSDSVINISGGSIGDGFDTLSSEVNISGGTVGVGFNARSDSEVNISGGIVGDGFTAFSGSEVNISGGTVGDVLNANPSSEVNLFGTEFLVDGIAMTELTVSEAFSLDDRDFLLSGNLADGSAFELELWSFPSGITSYVSRFATLTLTLIKPLSLPGDFNNDGTVDAADYTVWRDGLGKKFTNTNYDVWRDNYGATSFSSSSSSVPEPTTLVSLLIACLGSIRKRRVP